MIINHRYKFIFIKTRKTAGTSIEIALSRFCGKGDVLTPFSEVDEGTRRELGYPGPQNYQLPMRHFGLFEWFQLREKDRRFTNHSSARFIRKHIPRGIWNDYFKFSIDRDPFDKAISRYYWSTREPRPDLSDFLDQIRPRKLSNWEMYTIDDEIAVDFLARYENLDADLASVAERLGLPESLSLPRAKGAHRKERSHYSQVLDARARERIERVCAREILEFDYGWRDDPTG